jgi:hypothetical protein
MELAGFRFQRPHFPHVDYYLMWPTAYEYKYPVKWIFLQRARNYRPLFFLSRDRIAFAWMEPGAFLYLRVICSSPTFCYGISSTCGGCNCGCPGTWDPAFMRRQHCVNSPLLGRFLIKHLSCRSDGFLWVAFVSLHFTYKRRASVYHGICSSMHRLYKASCTATFFWLG